MRYFLLLFLFCGCSQSPLLSELRDTDDFGTFRETVSRLDQIYEIEAWIYSHRKYNLNCMEGWSDSAGRENVDNTLSLALAFWDKRGLLCGNFAGFVLLCARTHGYKCGGISAGCHIDAWVEHNGCFYVFCNGVEIAYKSRKEFLKNYKDPYFWNNKLQRIDIQ